MAIVATAQGGPVELSTDSRKRRRDIETVHALSWGEVDKVAARFQSLNPYDVSAISGSVLEIEDENFDPQTTEQRQLWCYAISAKRYALFLRDKMGAPQLLRSGENNEKNRWSQHGLGHLLNPTDLSREDREWIAQVWQGILNNAFNSKGTDLDFWDTPAVGRTSVSAPSILNSLETLNSGKDYPDQIKPFNFLLSCHVKQFGQPVGVDPGRFHLIAPFEKDPSKWTKLKWIDLHSGKPFSIATTGYSSRRTASVKTLGDFISDYRFHAEPKCADTKGKVCSDDTRGLLWRRHVQVDLIRFIGKESNLLEAVDEGLMHSTLDVYGEVVDLRRDEWERKIRPALTRFSISVLEKETGMSPRALKNARTGKTRPHPRNQALIVSVLRRLGCLS
jgi:hypothetical protein